MANSTPLILVLGAPGQTGSRVANNLTTRGLAVHMAARSGADVRHDAWVAGGIPAECGAVLRMLIETVASGRGSRLKSDVEKAIGTAPTGFAAFARRTAAAWAVDEAR